MKNIYLLILLIVPFYLSSQEDDSYNLDYNNSRNAAELCTEIKSSGFLSNAEADDALAKILSVVGASKRFIVAPCENINNALAVIDDGMRYILYDPEFINSISQTSNYWANMSILAHEVGHHINGHTLGPSLSAYENKIQELEADEFAGFVMQKIGSTLEQSIDAIASLAPSGDDTYSSHPNKERRIKAITKGFNNAKNNSFLNEKKLSDWEEYYFRGNEKYDAEDYEGAIEDFTESIMLKPDSNSYLKRALAKQEINDTSGEKFDLIRSIELNPNSWEAHYWLGRNLYLADDFFGALSAFESYTNLVNWSGDYYDLWSYYYIASSFRAKEIYNKAFETIDYVITETNFTTVIDPGYHDLFYKVRGNCYLVLENFELARKDYEKASELDPNYALYIELIGDTYAKEKNYEKAIEFYNQALELDADKYSIYQYRAYAYEATEDYFNALLDMNEAIKHAPDYGDLYFKRGEYSFNMGDQKSACSDWLIGREKGDENSLNKLIENCGYSKEDFYSAEEYIEAAMEERDNKNFEEALRLLNKSKEMGYKDLPRLNGSFYSVYYHSEQYDLALESLNKIELESEEQLIWWNNQYLYTNYALKNWSQLALKAEELIDQYKLDPDALDNSLDLDFINKNLQFVRLVFDFGGQSYFLSGDSEKAIDVGNKFLKVGRTIKNDEFIRYAYLRLGEHKQGAGDYLGALQDINEYIKIYTEYSVGYVIRGEIKLKMGENYKNYACDDFNLALQVSLKNEFEDIYNVKRIQKLIDDHCK